jgi:two-component system nitrate/nitrite response regulator NarL
MIDRPVRVVICDDHRLFADALTMALEAAGHRVVGRTATIEDGLDTVARLQPDLCLLDVRFPTGSGLDAITPMLAVSADTRIIVLSAVSDRATVVRALGAGAVGYVNKSEDLDAILVAAERVVAGHIVVSAGGPDVTEPDVIGPGFDLTVREREVLSCLGEGLSTPGIADHLGISYATARSHVQNLLMKLGVHSQLQAVAYAKAHGLI